MTRIYFVIKTKSKPWHFYQSDTNIINNLTKIFPSKKLIRFSKNFHLFLLNKHVLAFWLTILRTVYIIRASVYIFETVLCIVLTCIHFFLLNKTYSLLTEKTLQPSKILESVMCIHFWNCHVYRFYVYTFFLHCYVYRFLRVYIL